MLHSLPRHLLLEGFFILNNPTKITTMKTPIFLLAFLSIFTACQKPDAIDQVRAVFEGYRAKEQAYLAAQEKHIHRVNQGIQVPEVSKLWREGRDYYEEEVWNIFPFIRTQICETSNDVIFEELIQFLLENEGSADEELSNIIGEIFICRPDFTLAYINGHPNYRFLIRKVDFGFLNMKPYYQETADIPTLKQKLDSLHAARPFRDYTVPPQRPLHEILAGIPLYQKRVLGEMDTPKNSWLILSAKSCQDCDENAVIYVFPVEDYEGAAAQRTQRYSYPGKIFFYENDFLISESRLFWGNCLGAQKQELLWWQKEREGDGWVTSFYSLTLTDEGVVEKELTSVDLEDVEKRLAEGLCVEVMPKDQTSEP